ncbi:MAG: sigma factor-like helix-turn-helix DNA-binding protein [Rhodoglobus sp.]
MLFYLEDQSVATIAATMGLNSGTVKTHLSRARHALATQLAESAPTAQVAWA